MNSQFANIFLQIQSHLASLTDTDSNPLLRHIDQDTMQLQRKLRPALDYPCVLIDFENWKFSNAGESIQFGKGNVVLTIGFQPFDMTSEDVPEEYKEDALNFYEIENSIHEAVHNWTPPIAHVGSLTRIDADTVKLRPDMRIRKLVYELSFEDYTTETQQTTVEAAIKVSY